jgi:hypothetical protein
MIRAGLVDVHFHRDGGHCFLQNKNNIRMMEHQAAQMQKKINTQAGVHRSCVQVQQFRDRQGATEHTVEMSSQQLPLADVRERVRRKRLLEKSGTADMIGAK